MKKIHTFTFSLAILSISINSLAEESFTLKSDLGQIIFSQKVGDFVWRKAKYSNGTNTYDFPIDSPSLAFDATEENFSKNKKYYMLNSAHDESNGQRCTLVEMDSGCIIYEDFSELCSMQWSKEEDAVLKQGYPKSTHPIKDFDPRLKDEITLEDVEFLKSLNGSRTEKLCGISVSADNKVTFNPLLPGVAGAKKSSAGVKPAAPAEKAASIKAAPATAEPAKPFAYYQEIVKKCRVTCTKQDLDTIDVETINVSKEQAGLFNDLGFFLWKQELTTKSIELLKKVIAADGNRTVAYLNLADAQWDAGEKTEAKHNYAVYKDKIVIADKADKIPAKVIERLSLP